MDRLQELVRTGTVVELCNQIELYMKAIIEAYVSPPPHREGFLRNYVLNSAIVSFGSKIKLVLAINSDAKLVKLDSEALHKVSNLRNAFAHNDLISGIRADDPPLPPNPTVVLESISSSGLMKEVTREQAYSEFLVVHAKVEASLREMLGKVRA